MTLTFFEKYDKLIPLISKREEGKNKKKILEVFRNAAVLQAGAGCGGPVDDAAADHQLG